MAAGPELGFKLRRGQSSLLEVVNVPSLALVSELTVFFLLEKKKKKSNIVIEFLIIYISNKSHIIIEIYS